MDNPKIVIIGAGPAGMGCAYTLAHGGVPSVLVEQEADVGGLCRTIDHLGYLFDIGGHRFITKSDEVKKIWEEVLGSEFLLVKRLSRIYYRQRFFSYPLQFFDVVWHLGPLESLFCLFSYLRARFFPCQNNDSFEGWIINHFGRRLYNIFFKSYSEKVWEIPCSSLSSDWARQRIRGLSLRVALKNSIFAGSRETPKTLITQFSYPKRGPGQFYQSLRDACVTMGGDFSLNTTVRAIRHDNNKITAIETISKSSGEKRVQDVEYLFSSIPLPELIQALQPRPPDEVIAAVACLQFRSLIVVNIILDKEDVFPDQWLYIHEPNVKLGRIQNFKNWSHYMVTDTKKTSLGLEYFCNKGDYLWSMDDIELRNFALKELSKIGFTLRHHLLDSFVVRSANAYPRYTLDYREHLSVLRAYVAQFSNMQTIGRAGLFRYDNSDRALLSGVYAARNFLYQEKHDLWQFDTDRDFMES
ncbi:MAG: NAD(P)/FAD-dependent oxidoreductase [Candidatus Omnitrophota bacterium]